MKGWICLESPRDGSTSDRAGESGLARPAVAFPGVVCGSEDALETSSVTLWQSCSGRLWRRFVLGVHPVSFAFLAFSTRWVQPCSASTVTLHCCRSCGFCPSRLAPTLSFQFLGPTAPQVWWPARKDEEKAHVARDNNIFTVVAFPCGESTPTFSVL